MKVGSTPECSSNHADDPDMRREGIGDATTYPPFVGFEHDPALDSPFHLFLLLHIHLSDPSHRPLFYTSFPLPSPTSSLFSKLNPSAFFLRVDRPATENPQPGQPKTLLLSPTQSLDPQAYYAWFYDGSPLTTILGGAAMVVIMLAGVMFPLWPVKLRIGVWYLSILALGLLGALIVLAVVRAIFWCITVVVLPKAIWMFPNLFEDVGFVSTSCSS
jgi:translocation protein SEC62